MEKHCSPGYQLERLWEVNGNDSPLTKTTKKTCSLTQREEDRDGCTGKGFYVLLVRECWRTWVKEELRDWFLGQRESMKSTFYKCRVCSPSFYGAAVLWTADSLLGCGSAMYVTEYRTTNVTYENELSPNNTYSYFTTRFCKSITNW